MIRFRSRRPLLAIVCLAALGGVRASEIDKLVANLAATPAEIRNLAAQASAP